MRQTLLGMPRQAKVATMVATDALTLAVALWLALSLRYGEFWLPINVAQVACIAIASGTGVIALAFAGLYRWMVRYVSAQTLLVIFRALVVTALVLAFAMLLLRAELPRSTPILFALIATILVAGSRFAAQRLLRERHDGRRIPVVIYGAGSTGHQIGLSLHQGDTYRPVAYIDDNPLLQDRLAYGMRVHSPQALPRLIADHSVEQVLLAMPQLSNSRRREILQSLAAYSLKVRTVPRLQDVVAGRFGADDIQDVDPEDLLGRDPVPPRVQLLDARIAGRVVMVTGAGGSIGSELCRQILARQPTMLVLFELSEFALYAIEGELQAAAAKLPHRPRIVALLGSVQDGRLLREVMQRFQVQTVFHAAAYKHVPLVEHNVIEGVRNNIFGTREAALAARDCGVESFTLISTDKAVRPTNVMGASKRVAELVLQSINGDSHTCFCMVRFGNVLGSSGSVVPLFRDQIRRGGPVTVTHPDIIRYFMTIPEAAQLVIQASAMGHGGDVFLLDMGEPVRIAELAKRMIHLMGYHERTPEQPDGDIAIEFTGLRPGEKLYEELLVGDASMPTEHPRIMRAMEHGPSRAELDQALADIEACCRERDVSGIHACLEKLRIGFVSSGNSDHLYNGKPGDNASGAA